MSYRISDDCINCGACEPECLNLAISQGKNVYVIDPEKCSECVGSYKSSRCTEICPVDACRPDSSHRETKQQLLEKWRRLHPGKEPTPGTY